MIDIFIFEVVFLENVGKSLIFSAVVLFCVCAEAGAMHEGSVLVYGTVGLGGVYAVVLVVWEIAKSADKATEVVKSIYTNIDDCFAVVNPVSADEVSSFSAKIVVHITVSTKLAIGILNALIFTL